MFDLKAEFRAFAADDSGVTALEYGLIAAIVSVGIIGALLGVGDKLKQNIEIVVLVLEGEKTPGSTLVPDGPEEENGSPDGEQGGEGTSDEGGGGGQEAEDRPGTEVARDETRTHDGEKAGDGTGRASGGGAGTSGRSASSGSQSWGGGLAGGPSSVGAAGGAMGSGDGAASADGGAAVAEAFGEESEIKLAGGGVAARIGDGAGATKGSAHTGESAESDLKSGSPSDSAAASSFLILSLWSLAALALIVLGWLIVRRAINERRAQDEADRSERAVIRFRAAPEGGAAP